MDEIIKSYATAQKRLFLLDYDGTLSPFTPTPLEAAPSEDLLSILRKLTSDPQNTIVIISGRGHDTLDQWLGHLRLDFGAEHGLLIRKSDKKWQTTRDVDSSWKSSVNKIMKKYTDDNPGSFVEEKSNSLAWHTRIAKNITKASRAHISLGQELEKKIIGKNLRLLRGNMVIEVQPSGVSKGLAAQNWLNQDYDFVLAAGDDTTDEDMFLALPVSAHSIKIGKGITAANFRLKSPDEFVELLQILQLTIH